MNTEMNTFNGKNAFLYEIELSFFLIKNNLRSNFSKNSKYSIGEIKNNFIYERLHFIAFNKFKYLWFLQSLNLFFKNNVCMYTANIYSNCKFSI